MEEKRFLDEKGLSKLINLLGNQHKNIEEKITIVKEIDNEEDIVDNKILYLNPESKTIFYNGVKYGACSWTVFGEDQPYLDVVFYDKNTKDLKVIGDPEKWDTENNIPIGIVVVPASHDIYGTGEAGAVSLVNMSWQTPDVGDVGLPVNNDGSKFYFGYTGHGLTLSQSFPIQGRCDGPVLPNISEYINSNAQLPTDKTSLGMGPSCLTDKSAHYAVDIDPKNNNRGWTPSPYGSRGTRNPLYYYGGASSNSLARYDGKNMTETFINKATGQKNWKTDETLTKSYDANFYPAACACWRFHTEGTEQGDWYLPEIGELGYLPPRYKKLDDTLELINKKFGVSYTTPINYDQIKNYYSSTPTSNGSCRISTLNGSLGSQGASSEACVRAFLRINY